MGSRSPFHTAYHLVFAVLCFYLFILFKNLGDIYYNVKTKIKIIWNSRTITEHKTVLT